MEIILTHPHTDFDALAAQQAAARVYPHAYAVLAHQLNANVAEFVGLHGAELRLVGRADLPAEAVTRFILVDTDRRWGDWQVADDCQTIIIDHHSESHNPNSNPAEPVPTIQRITAAVGATTTILVQQLLEHAAPFSPTEATLFLLGIYEDTGDLTYTDTTPTDLRIAATLLERGADLSAISQYRHRGLTPAQDSAYQALFDQLRSTEIGGWPVLTAWAQLEQHTPGLSGLAERLRDIYAPAVLILALGIGDGGTQLIGRADAAALDLGALMAEWGGGGHAQAAAAFVRDRAPEALCREIEARLPALITPATTAAEIMTRAVRSLQPDSTIRDAAEVLRRWSYNAVPIIDEQGALLGDIGRTELTKAERHGLSAVPVRRYLWRSPTTIAPATPLREVRRLVANDPRGRVYVVDPAHQLLGLITRGDILHHTERSSTPAGADAEHTAQFAAALDLRTCERAYWASAWAAGHGWGVYAVGGFVRDVLLGRPPGDLDLVVEGDAIAVATALAQQTEGQVRAHHQFGTATVEWLFAPDGHLDFITARTEFYEHPTALPEIEAASLRHDLHRRDFTINTLALALTPARRGHLYDFYGGLRDLQHGLIRVLHNLSFIDDPTRLLRAIRLAARLSFQIEDRTGELIADAIAQDVLNRTTAARIRHELRLLLEEDQAAAALALLDQWKLLAAIHPDLRWDAGLAAAFAEVQTRNLPAHERRTLLLLLLLSRLPAPERQALGTRYSLPKIERAQIDDYNQLEAHGAELAQPQLSAGELDALLAPYNDLALQALAQVSGGVVAERIERYRTVLRLIPSQLSGRDLRAQGLPPGPEYRRLLAEARAKQLDGWNG
ncbi:MAG: CBS domain-containing protein [Herpetosiphonaceae bacterium]|nr:CBS domain-containing protein [Herpetosiphonaceae bacterium]